MHAASLWWATECRYQGRTLRTCFARGNGGQEVVVIADLDLVIAAHGGSDADKGGWSMVREYIPGRSCRRRASRRADIAARGSPARA